MAVEPMYKQIAEHLITKIRADKIKPGSKLPSEIELMAEYSASRNTIRDALKLLTARAMVEVRPGQGTYVVEKVVPFVQTLSGPPDSWMETRIYVGDVQKSGRDPTQSDIDVRIRSADSALADILRVEEGSQLVSRHQDRFIDGIPWSRQTSFYPMHYVTAKGAAKLLEARDIEDGAIAYLAECGVNQVGYQDSIEVRKPDAAESLFFRIPDDGRVPLIEIYRLRFAAEEERMGLTVSVYPADRNRFLIRNVPENW